MKRITIILLTISILAAQLSNAQNCPSAPTYANQSGTFTLSAGRSIVLNDGKLYNITIQNTFAANASICVLNGSTVNLSFQNVNAINNGKIYVDATSTLALTGNSINKFPLSLTNKGTVTQQNDITFTDSATITNNGSYTATGVMNMSGGKISIDNSNAFSVQDWATKTAGTFTITNHDSANMKFINDVTFTSISINNSATMNFYGALTLQNAGAQLTNQSYVYLLTGDLTINNSASVQNNGLLYVQGAVSVSNSATLTNSCTIKTVGSFTNNKTATVNNTGSVLLDINTTAGAFANQGTFTNGSTSLVQGYDFINTGSITGAGSFYFANSTTNNGTFAGSKSSDKIVFYDPSQTSSSRYFDVQTVTPSSTSKKIVTPNTATSFTSCSDAGAPLISVQPATQVICNSTTTTATFSITASNAANALYQWFNNGTPIFGATASNYTATGLTLADTANKYTVSVQNGHGITTSQSASIKYIILSQPSPAVQTLVTGNATSFSIQTSGALPVAWTLNGATIANATSTTYNLPVVTSADSGSYAAVVTYNGNTCTSNSIVVKAVTVIYSSANGDISNVQSWGANTDGSGSTPVDFSRPEHTFVVANRKSATMGGKHVAIAGTLDVAAANVAIQDNTTLSVGRIIRSVTGGVLSATLKDSLIIQGIGPSDLYFDKANNTLQRLTINGNTTTTLRTSLNIANDNGTRAGSNGIVVVNGGTFYTNDSLTLKSDKNGSGSIGASAGTIVGKVTVEKYITNKRSWRLMGAPVATTGAPTIHDSYQEGAVSSTDNPHPGYGTHITYGALTDGYDQNPQKSFSMKVLTNNAWVGVPAPNKTKVTDYPAYMLFIRGNRSYPITSTASNVAATSTILRVTGNVNQGAQAAKTVNATGVTLVSNPFACPVNFTKIKAASTNVKARIRMWDPSLSGTKGVGGWVTVNGTTGTYKTTPPSSISTLIQAGQGFFVESADSINTGSLVIDESAKDLSSITTSADKEVMDASADTSLEVNLRVMNTDSSFAIADGVLYNFNANFSDTINADDAAKFYNFNENLGIKENNTVLTIDNRTMVTGGDSLKLTLTGTTSSTYQLQILPSASLNHKSFSLVDKYLNTVSPINANDTTIYTFAVNTADAASKATDRFTIVVNKTMFLLPVTFTKVKAYRTNNSAQVAWNVENENNIISYEVEKSVNGTQFTKEGSVKATSSKAYSFTDATPAKGINYYRVKSIGVSGDINYTGIVSVDMNTTSAAAPSMSVYPNPLTSPSFTLTLTNLTAGTYTLQVTNTNGTALFSQLLSHTGATASQKITMSKSLVAGIYFVKLVSQNGTVTSVKVMAH